MKTGSAQQNAPITKVKELGENGSFYLELSPSSAVHSGEISELAHKIAQEGWFSVPANDAAGNPILRIYGYQDPSKVNDFLKKEKYIDESSQTEIITAKSRKRKDTLISSGIFYLLGDFLYLGGGKMLGNKDISIGSAIKALSSGLLVYGRSVNPDNPLHDFIKRTSKELEKSGIKVSEYKDPDMLAGQLEKSPSFKQGFDKFLSDYSVETLIGINTLGDVFFSKSGKRKKEESPEPQAASEKKTQTFDEKLKVMGTVIQGRIGLGTSVNLFVTRLMMENKHRMNPKGDLFKVTQFLEKTALPIRAWGNTAGNVLSIVANSWSAIKNVQATPYQQMGQKQKTDFLGNLLVAAANLIFLGGNIQYGRGKQKKEMPFAMEEASTAFANILLGMPSQKRLEAVNQVSSFFATQDPEGRPAEYHKQQLFEQIEKLKDSPFVSPQRVQLASLSASGGQLGVMT